jgi:hypothetical protein
MLQAPTPRKTRSPRIPSDFRISTGIAVSVSSTFKHALLQALRDPQHPRYNPRGMASTVRAALQTHYRKARSIQVPAAYRPTADYRDNSTIATPMKSEALRSRYEATAYNYGITMSELMLRCLTAYMGDAEKR